jgi:hypothetical protein
MSINPKNLTFQAAFMVVANFTVAQWLILTTKHGLFPLKGRFNLKNLRKNL